MSDAEDQASTDKLMPEQLNFLRLELTLLDGKMKQIVDRLWQIRALCVTLWAGAVAIGLGVGTGDKSPVPSVLLVTALFPVWFAWIDSSYQRWYRRFRAREEAISRFVHDPAFTLPANEQPMSLRESVAVGALEFPVLDLYAEATYGRTHPKIRWFTSRWSNLGDTTPSIVYGVQLATSTVLISVKVLPSLWWFFPLMVIVLLSTLVGIGFGVKRRILGQRETTTANADSESRRREMSKPTGSGYFATAAGVVFILALIGSFFGDVRKLDPEWIIRVWLAFVAAILIGWGVNRIRTGTTGPVGQDTINFVLAVVGATFALLALFQP